MTQQLLDGIRSQWIERDIESVTAGRAYPEMTRAQIIKSMKIDLAVVVGALEKANETIREVTTNNVLLVKEIHRLEQELREARRAT